MNAKMPNTSECRAHLIVPGDPDTLTGGSIYDRLMAVQLRKLGWDVTVTGLEGRFPDADRTAVRAVQNCLSSIADGSLVVVDGLALGAVPELAAQHACRLKLIGLVHHPLGDETGLSDDRQQAYHVREVAALSVTRGIVVTSGFTARRLCQLGVDAQCIRVAIPSVDPAPLATGCNGAGRHMLCVATVTPRKRHDVLLRALGRLRQADWTLTCIGDIERSKTWSRKIFEILKEEGIAEKVNFRGGLSDRDLSMAYDGADLFVLASEYEGYGMVLTEALARGLPVVATTGGAIAETVPSRAGVLVPPGDSAALSEALSGLLGDAVRFEEVKAGAVAVRGGLQNWASAGKTFDRYLREFCSS